MMSVSQLLIFSRRRLTSSIMLNKRTNKRGNVERIFTELVEAAVLVHDGVMLLLLPLVVGGGGRRHGAHRRLARTDEIVGIELDERRTNAYELQKIKLLKTF